MIFDAASPGSSFSVYPAKFTRRKKTLQYEKLLKLTERFLAELHSSNLEPLKPGGDNVLPSIVMLRFTNSVKFNS